VPSCNLAKPGDGEKLVDLAWDDWHLVSVLRNIAILGGQRGEVAIRALISTEFRLALHQLGVRVQRDLGDSSGQRTRAHISDIEK
jgi:hypothetical protein